MWCWIFASRHNGAQVCIGSQEAAKQEKCWEWRRDISICTNVSGYLPNSSLCQGSFIVTVRECEWKICTWTIARCSSYVFPISRILQYTGSRWVISSSKHLTPLFLWKENKFAACFLNNTCKSWSSRHSVFGSCLNKNYFATLKFATLCLCFYWTSQANSLWTHLGASTHYSAVQLIHFRTVHS